jgi:DNA-directed RNA polymerase specialized sigma24 family protein
LPSPSISAAERSDYLDHLTVIREDPQVKKLARARAGDPDVAEDALQETFYLLARLRQPQHIDDLRKYFCKVLIHSVYRLRGQLGATTVDDAGGLVDTSGRRVGGEAPPALFDEVVHTNMVARNWHERLAKQRAALTGSVPGRSPEPGRYRDVIMTTAEGMLLAIVTGDFREVDLNLALRAAYPEWFAERRVAISNIHQRLARARADIRDLLKAVISLDELRS